MPPRAYSRHMFTVGITGSDGITSLTLRKPYRFRVFEDTIAHRVRDGDTLWTIAGRYYREVERGCGLWWIIADFQPTPIHDPTVSLTAGSVLFVPSLRVVIEKILSETRRRDATG